MGQRLDRPAKAKKKNNKKTAQLRGHDFTSRSELELATSSELATETITKRMQVQRASRGNLEPEEIYNKTVGLTIEIKEKSLNFVD